MKLTYPKLTPKKGFSPLTYLAAGIIAFIIAICVLSGAFYKVDEGSRGIILRSGQISSIATPGLGMKLPFFDKVVQVNTRTQKITAKTIGQSRDNQIVNMAIVVNYHYDADKLGTIYSKYGFDLGDKVITPRVEEIAKAVIASFSASTMISERKDVKSMVDVALRKELSKYDVVVESVMITSFAFNDSYQEAIEATQIAEQGVLKATQELEIAKKTAQRDIEIARGNAEAARITAESLRTQGGEEYVRLEAVKKWDGRLPTYMSPGAPTPFVNIK